MISVLHRPMRSICQRNFLLSMAPLFCTQPQPRPEALCRYGDAGSTSHWSNVLKMSGSGWSGSYKAVVGCLGMVAMHSLNSRARGIVLHSLFST